MGLSEVYLLLASCARAECSAAHYGQLARLASQVAEWDQVPAQAEAHGMAPLLYVHLQAAGAPIPLNQKRELQALYLRHRHANQARTRLLGDIVTLYNAAGIRAIILKGAALAHIVYAEPGLRPMSDLDILVPLSQLQRAHSLLAELGFTVPPSFAPTPHRHLGAATLQREGLMLQVEIHHKLFSDYFDGVRAYARSIIWPCGASRAAEKPDGLTAPPYPFTAAGQAALTLGCEDMLWHLCQHLVSHVNVWDCSRLIWTADIVSFSERFARQIDWQRIRREHPSVLDTLSLLHCATPLSDELLDLAKIKTGRAPQGIGVNYQGWPKIQARDKNIRRILSDTLLPSEWWLRLRYRLGSTRPMFWYRWVRHPLHILAQVARAMLERIGWPAFAELAQGRPR